MTKKLLLWYKNYYGIKRQCSDCNRNVKNSKSKDKIMRTFLSHYYDFYLIIFYLFSYTESEFSLVRIQNLLCALYIFFIS